MNLQRLLDTEKLSRKLPPPRNLPMNPPSRFELSEEDRQLLKATHEVVEQQGVVSEEQHNTVIFLMRQFEKRLDMSVRDMRQEIRVNLGNNVVDLDAKEQLFLTQIVMLLDNPSLAEPSSGTKTSSITGE